MDKMPGLSPRQCEIMELAAQGMTDKEIAQTTGLSVGTLRSHWDRMRARLGASSRSEVIARAFEDALRTLREELHALREELDVLRRALAQRRTCVWTATADGQVDFVNDWLSEFSGLPTEALLGAGCAALASEAAPSAEAGTQIGAWWQATGREGRRTCVLLRAASGALVPHQIEFTPLATEDGRVVRWLGTGSEVA